MTDALTDLAEARRLIESIDTPALPDAYLRDTIHLRLLEAVTRAVGREPFPPLDAVAHGFPGIPIYLDPTMPPDRLELRWPDGRVEVVDLAPARHRTFPADTPGLGRSWFGNLPGDPM